MKILLLSAGTKKHGATSRAVLEAEGTLLKLGAETETVEICDETIPSCSACGVCKKTGCCVHKDSIRSLGDRLYSFDGFIFFTPVHYGGAAGSIKSALGRLFYSKKKSLEYKPASAVAIARRGGNISALEEITRFFSFASMPYVPGNYPGIIYGRNREEVQKDEEGLKTIRTICENMVWLICAIEAGTQSGIEHP